MKADKIAKEISKILNRNYGTLILSIYGYTISFNMRMPNFVPDFINIWLREILNIPKPKITYNDKPFPKAELGKMISKNQV